MIHRWFCARCGTKEVPQARRPRAVLHRAPRRAAPRPGRPQRPAHAATRTAPRHPGVRPLVGGRVTEQAICPECAAGKHPNCDGTAWDHERDELTTCQCREGVCA